MNINSCPAAVCCSGGLRPSHSICRDGNGLAGSTQCSSINATVIDRRYRRMIHLAAEAVGGTILSVKTRRGGRVVYGSGLENRQGASPRGFESHPLRHCKSCGQPPNLICEFF